eukprot:419432-Prorocentrum_minimum.AAC.1
MLANSPAVKGWSGLGLERVRVGAVWGWSGLGLERVWGWSGLGLERVTGWSGLAQFGVGVFGDGGFLRGSVGGLWGLRPSLFWGFKTLKPFEKSVLAADAGQVRGGGVHVCRDGCQGADDWSAWRQVLDKCA